MDVAVLKIPPHVFELTDGALLARVLEITCAVEIRLAHRSPHEFGFAQSVPVVVHKPDPLAPDRRRRKIRFGLKLELVRQLPQNPGKLASAVGAIEGFVLTANGDLDFHVASLS
jgi:hypothetical protein